MLIVEDHEELRYYLRKTFEHYYRVIDVANGKEALDYLSNEYPDLILSDVMMPGIQGDELCQMVKENPDTAGIPFILLTAKTNYDAVVEGLKKGADDYIPKPFSTEILKLKVRGFIENRNRPQFEMMTGDLLARTVAPVQNALRDAGISASQLGKVLLVGGSTRMPAVERQVKELLGCEPSHSLNPDECVAMGAAVQGGLLQGGGKLAGASGAAAQGLVLMDVTPLTLSIETLGGVATPLITRNSMIPTRKSQIFTTARPMQTSVEINVLQGERHFARDNKSLGKFKLNGIRASFSSKPQIEVTFDIDVNGVVKVSAKDLGTGREQNITITGSTNLSENEIQRAMADAAAYEAEDSRRKERLDLHNQAEVLAYKVDEALSKCKKELDKEEKNRIKADVANLRRCLRKDKPEKMNETEEANLRQAKSQLEASANHLMVLYASEQSENGSDGTI